MKLKKPMKIKAPGADSAAGGGATIADRFRLDAPVKGDSGESGGSKTAAALALAAAVAALGVTGGLLALMNSHLDFMNSGLTETVD